MTCLFCIVSWWKYHLWLADNWRPQIFWWLQCILENQLRWGASRSYCKFCMPFICSGCGDNNLALTACVNDDWKKTEHFQINSSSYSSAHCKSNLDGLLCWSTLLVSASSLYFFSPTTVRDSGLPLYSFILGYNLLFLSSLFLRLIETSVYLVWYMEITW